MCEREGFDDRADQSSSLEPGTLGEYAWLKNELPSSVFFLSQKMAENGGFSMGKSAIFSVWSRGFQSQTIDLAAFMSTDFFGAREQEKCRAPFSNEDSVDVAPWGRVRLDA